MSLDKDYKKTAQLVTDYLTIYGEKALDVASEDWTIGVLSNKKVISSLAICLLLKGRQQKGDN